MTYYSTCTAEETAARFEICKSCMHFVIQQELPITRCAAAELDINLIISCKEITCPEGNW